MNLTAEALLGKRALLIHVPFATSYLGEVGFSVVDSIKTNYRSRLDCGSLKLAFSLTASRG